MVGLPFIGTVGACAGKMVALTSPGELAEKYNWARVLRHEFMHVLNLQQTDFNIPHWFTEGPGRAAGRPAAAARLDGAARAAGEGGRAVQPGRHHARLRAAASRATIGRWPIASRSCTSSSCWRPTARMPRKSCSPPMPTAARRPQAVERCFGVEAGGIRSGLSSVSRQDCGRFASSCRRSRSRRWPSCSGKSKRSPTMPMPPRELRPRLARSRRQAAGPPLGDCGQKLKANQPLAAYVLARLQLSIGDAEAAVKLLEGALDRRMPAAKSCWPCWPA